MFMPNSEIITRILSGIVLGVLAVLYIFYSDLYVFAGVAALISVIAVNEYARALMLRAIPISRITPIILHALALASLWLFWQGPQNYAQTAGLALAVVLVVEVLFGSKRNKMAAWWLTLPLVWISLPFFVMVLLHSGSPLGPQFIFYVILTAASNDSFAYFGGKRFGKTPLAKAISPNKTIEGSLFGLVGALIVGGVTGHYLFDFFAPLTLAAINVGIVVTAQIGDLLESKFKRYCGIKDSGAILPGHGGILDRFDAYLTSLPFFWLVLWLMGYTGLQVP